MTDIYAVVLGMRSQCLHTHTHSQEIEEIMEKLGNVGTEVFVLPALERIFRYSFVCLRYAVPVSMHFRLCLVTARMKAPQNGKLVRFSERTEFWCAFSWRICNKNGQFIWCLQRSGFQCYDGIHKPWVYVTS
jgi:hypothetical protein